VIAIVRSFSAYADPIVDLTKLARFGFDASAQVLSGMDSGAGAECLLAEMKGG
jgi:hypothetical protein